jgi:hypothetical protein
MSISKKNHPTHSEFNPGKHFPAAFDIDGIVLDTGTLMWETITRHLGLSWPLSRWTSYSIEDIVGVSTKSLRPVYEPVLARTDLPEVRGAGHFLSELYRKYDMPLLFITARRAQFKDSAIESIKKILDWNVRFEVLCTGEKYDEEFRNDKLDLLKKYKVQLFIEDNHLHWEDYIDAGVKVGTLKWPWTEKPYFDMKSKGKEVAMFSDWPSLFRFICKNPYHNVFPWGYLTEWFDLEKRGSSWK